MLNRIEHQKSAWLPLACAVAAFASFGTGHLHAQAQPTSIGGDMLLLTATNGTANSLAVIDTRTHQVSYVPTGGNGGASGNAGGVAVQGPLAAVVNFGSSTVTLFVRFGNSLIPTQTVRTSSKPLSVAFGNNHLIVLGLTTAESFPLYGVFAGGSDGNVTLERADGSAAQIVTFNGHAAYSEKSGAITELNLSASGLAGPNMPVALPPAPNNNTPFGMVGRGANVYATIAHSDLETLIVNGTIISSAQGPTPYTDSFGDIIHAPCWNALYGQFLFSSDSPAKQLLRFLVSDANVFFDKAAVATLSGPPTDLDVNGSVLGVIDGGDGTNSDASVFDLSSEGEMTLRFAVKIPGPINGAALMD